MSEVYGRSNVYRASYALLFLFSFPVTFAPNIAVYLIFRFLTGFCGSAFLSVAGGSVSDLFDNKSVAKYVPSVFRNNTSSFTAVSPMAFYTLSPFVGPVFGPLISG